MQWIIFAICWYSVEFGVTDFRFFLDCLSMVHQSFYLFIPQNSNSFVYLLHMNLAWCCYCCILYCTCCHKLVCIFFKLSFSYQTHQRYKIQNCLCFSHFFSCERKGKPKANYHNRERELLLFFCTFLTYDGKNLFSSSLFFLSVSVSKGRKEQVAAQQQR